MVNSPIENSQNTKVKKPHKKKKKRCSHQECKKKLKITDYACKCGNIYCSSHRHNHKCTFDFQKEAREKLTKQNPLVIPSKIQVV